MTDKTKDALKKLFHLQIDLEDIADHLLEIWDALSPYDDEGIFQICFACNGHIYEGEDHEPDCAFEEIYIDADNYANDLFKTIDAFKVLLESGGED